MLLKGSSTKAKDIQDINIMCCKNYGQDSEVWLGFLVKRKAMGNMYKKLKRRGGLELW